ncbi:hypothetical protein IC007_1693 [Sulfuracidifex tepidarius]|uniref:RNA methyltransferase n=1 Tax=Sulfuracidifex tepidarius TaxID=1294262 RepID=A0A510E3S5_9CREN|nr:hypothetical protein IC007_1693 [Sulfuracidifex tepidarius]
MISFPRRKPLNVVLFLSIFDKKDLRYVTEKFSFIIRILSIFRVSNVTWVNDIGIESLTRLIHSLYEYSILPPYLKKELSMRRELKYVGLLSPLNLPSHPRKAEPIEGELRFGSKGNFGLEITSPCRDCEIMMVDSIKKQGIKYPSYVQYSGPTQKIIDKEDLCPSLSGFVIVGSRNGENPMECLHQIRRKYDNGGTTLIIGPPKGKIIRIVNDCSNKNDLDVNYYNFVPKQGVRDVRAEEALAISLSVLNVIIN